MSFHTRGLLPGTYYEKKEKDWQLGEKRKHLTKRKPPHLI